jgi:hypothetical protein
MYMVVFGAVQIFFSQVPNFHDLWWLSFLAAIMSFTYASIAVGLSLAQVISGTMMHTIAMPSSLIRYILDDDMPFNPFLMECHVVMWFDCRSYW